MNSRSSDGLTSWQKQEKPAELTRDGQLHKRKYQRLPLDLKRSQSNSARNGGEHAQMRKSYFAVTLALLILAFASPVMGVEEAPPEVPLEWVHGIWAAAKAAPVAIVMALITSLAGYFSKTAPENFKLENFLFTTLISFLVGFLSIYAGWSYSQIELWLANGFLTWYIWKLAKILARTITRKLSPTPTTDLLTTAQNDTS